MKQTASPSQSAQAPTATWVAVSVASAVLLVGLFELSQQNFLLFHSILEICGICLGVTVFSIGWYARRFARNDLLLILATAMVPIALLDLGHTLTFKGLGIFPVLDAGFATQFWVAGRILESLALLLAVCRVITAEPIRPKVLLSLFLLTGSILVLTIYPLGLFPVCFVPGTGLTAFKIGAEYVTCLILLAAGVILWKRRQEHSPHLRNFLLAAIVAKILAEINFTLYTDVYGAQMYVGHVLRLLSYILVYRALVEGSLGRPYAAMFRDLVHSEERLQAELLDRQRSKEEALHAQEMAENANRAKSAFLANMSHEIRTPMNAIIGMSEMVLDGELQPAQRERLDLVNQAARHLLKIINDILDLSKIEAGRLELEESEFPLRILVKNCLQIFEIQAEEKGIELCCDIHPDVPELLIGDAERLSQVLINLLSNAIKFTAQGQVRLEVDVLDDVSTQPCEIHFRVRDTGIGIAPENLHKLFKNFSQADSDISRKFGGTGLGLAICKTIIECMGGQIMAESEPGKGSVFTFGIPFEVAELCTSSPLPQRTTDTSPRDCHRALAKSQPTDHRILVAEDHPVNQKLTVTLLEKRGYQVTLVETGRDVVEAFQKEPYSAILMDVRMPDMDGITATKAIRVMEKGQGRHIPIIGLSAQALKEDQQASLDAGMDDYLTKPVRPLQLYEALETWIGMDGKKSEKKSTAVINLRKLQDTVNHDMELLGSLIDRFLKETPTRMTHLAQHMNDNRLAEVELSAHAIKSTLGIFGAQQAAELAGQVEFWAAQGNQQEVQTRWPKLEERINQVSSELSRLEF